MAHIRFLRHAPPFMPGDTTAAHSAEKAAELVKAGIADYVPEEKDEPTEKSSGKSTR